MMIIWLLARLSSSMAYAQPEVLGTWLWEVTTQDGDAIVEPGETAQITLSIDFNPDVGDFGLSGGEIFGLALVEFDTLGLVGADEGQIVGWEILNNLDLALGDLTTTDGTSLFGTWAEQPNLLGPFSFDDPIDVIKVEWQPSRYADQSVTYATNTEQFRVWEGPINSPQSLAWPVRDAQFSFSVVPSPHSLVVLTIAGIAIGRMRRLR